MSTLLGEKLKEAIDKKNEDLTTFTWKGSKSLDSNGKYVQEEMRLVDMSNADLIKAYDHCKKMLFNKDGQNPGRYVVLENISDQKDRCGVELFLRFAEQEYEMSRFTSMTNTSTFLGLNKEALKGITPTLKHMYSNLPDEFENLELNLIIDGCLDRLGAFNKKHITRTFILKQGIWLTPSESKELLKPNEPKGKDTLPILREALNVKDLEKLNLNSRGLNYTQMRAMLNLKPNKKYKDLTTVQLETLRNRILFDLEEDVKNHIYAWEKRMEEIEAVINYKGYKL